MEWTEAFSMCCEEKLHFYLERKVDDVLRVVESSG